MAVRICTAFFRGDSMDNEWNRFIPEVIKELKSEYTEINPMIRDDIFGILEKYCNVIYYPLENEENRGFHTQRFIGNKREDFVYINTAKPLAEQVFTAAHELGHVWGVADKITRKIDYDVRLKSEEEEQLINRFAAELLMPEDSFRKMFSTNLELIHGVGNKFRFEDFIKVLVLQMNDFMVPYESVRRRMIETHIISEEIGEYLNTKNDLIIALIKEYSKDLNTVLDNVTRKKTIPGLRGLLEKIERESLLDEYTICKIKCDFDIGVIENSDSMIDIKIEDNVDGEE